MLAAPTFVSVLWPFVAALVFVLAFRYYFSEEENERTSTGPHAWTDKDIRVSKILIHPIKSGRGISLQEVKYTPAGLEHDRTWCITDAATNAGITAREIAKMVLVTPEISVDESVPHGGLLNISFPVDAGVPSFSIPLRPTPEILATWEKLEHISIWSHDTDGYVCQFHNSNSNNSSPSSSNASTPSSILSTFLGRSVNLMYKGSRPRVCDKTDDHPKLKATVAYQDGYPLLVLSKESVAEVDVVVKGQIGKQGVDESWRQGKVAVERFRPNIVFEGAGAFAEDQWEKVVIGEDPENVFTLVSKCSRCLLPNVSPETGIRDKAVPFKVLMKFRTGVDKYAKMNPCMGCNAVSAKSGVLRVGQKVTVKEWILPEVEEKEKEL